MLGVDVFHQLISLLTDCIIGFPDPRTGKNTRYSMRDVALSAFSVFFTQSPSFLLYQRSMQRNKNCNNGRTLFGIEDIPTDTQIRNILDQVNYYHLDPVFTGVISLLGKSSALESYRVLGDQLLVCLDGTEFFSSEALSCPLCSSRTLSNGKVNHFHTALTPAIVQPGNSRVLPLAPEIISPQDGHDKQDCENAAAKRWLDRWGSLCKTLGGVTLLGDDLYSKQTLCRPMQKAGLNFILVCKPTSHPWLADWIRTCDPQKDLHGSRQRVWDGRRHLTHITRWINGVPLTSDPDSLQLNWVELVVLDEKGKETYHNSWVTTHLLSADNVEPIIQAGRCRWKIENENNNTLKTKGYHLEHNFGHGKKNLSNVLLTLNIVAFLFHTVLEIFDSRYRLLRQTLVRRDTFFNDVRALTRYICFDGWKAMLQFMLRGLELEDPGG
jgi:hypothetical protein